jgi:Arc/MetJ-type ribon-helix-helix transcriptional regulator
MYHPTMPKRKITISLDFTLLDEIDNLVRQGRFANRDEAIASAVSEHLIRIRRTRLAEACALLDPAEECALAEEDIDHAFVSWPTY